MTKRLFEAYGDETSAKDGGFVFQAIISHAVKWEIVDGETRIDPKNISATLHQVDVFPDIKLTEGSALLTYVILSEVNILKRKFELASEAIKKRLKPDYASEINAIKSSEMTTFQKKDLTAKHFKGTYYEASLLTDKIVLREVSTSGLDSGSPRIVLKISTSMVDTLDGVPIQTWEKFRVEVDGSQSLTLPSTSEKMSSIKEYDEIEKSDDLIFQTIVPSLILEFKGDSVSIDTYTSRSSLVAVGSEVDYDNLFKVDTVKKPQSTEAVSSNK